ncbi:uncharacterized protein METZ01_LOCUS223218, partial [marine metagenome]
APIGGEDYRNAFGDGQRRFVGAAERRQGVDGKDKRSIGRS